MQVTVTSELTLINAGLGDRVPAPKFAPPKEQPFAVTAALLLLNKVIVQTPGDAAQYNDPVLAGPEPNWVLASVTVVTEYTVTVLPAGEEAAR